MALTRATITASTSNSDKPLKLSDFMPKWDEREVDDGNGS